MTELSIIAVAGYIAAFVLIHPKVVTPCPTSRIFTLLAGFIALAAHGWQLHMWIDTAAGQNLSFFNVTSMVAWIAGLMVCLGALRYPLHNMLLFTTPMAALSIFCASFIAGETLLVLKDNPQALAHILISLAAYSILLVAAIQALLLLYLDRQLHKHRKLSILKLLPPLQTMEQLLFQILWIGFTALVIALATGISFMTDMSQQKVAHHTVLSIIAATVIGGLLFGRHRYGWRGKTAVRWTLIGYGLLLLAYFGSKAVLEMLLGA
ncbi:cytochrome C assembly family protein [Pelagibaculum spongiae]|uniref:Cytochrome c assembly protein domain-containing protein n=1 Tax=Pelagibaculum spongiae TaxID=2080658 RepID=A0A2V1GQZ9_9GAMM|nr:cytochrome c biogenesis protein CcsA [Pelagibaculum spongiae]PVZ62989.1 hypothetical protein DC094_21725 [Pelagibaculum spongiae]